MDSAFNCKVNRRFSDFEWLSQTLINKYPGYIIPEIPEKNFLASMNFEKSEFIEARRRDLENFLGKLLEHRYLRNAEEVRAFILDDEKVNRDSVCTFPIFFYNRNSQSPKGKVS